MSRFDTSITSEEQSVLNKLNTRDLDDVLSTEEGRVAKELIVAGLVVKVRWRDQIRYMVKS